MSTAFWPPTSGTPQATAPQAFFGTEPGYVWWLIGLGEIIGVRLDATGSAVAIAHGTVGRFLTGDRPLGGATGYDTWHPLPGVTPAEGAWGYWIAHTPANPAAMGGDQR